MYGGLSFFVSFIQLFSGRSVVYSPRPRSEREKMRVHRASVLPPLPDQSQRADGEEKHQKSPGCSV